MIDSCVLTSPCWLAEHLDEAGVADRDWTREIPLPVIEVVEAMYEALMADAYTRERREKRRPEALRVIAEHFAAAKRAHVEAVERNRMVPPDGWDDEYGPLPEPPVPPLPGAPVVPLGGPWQPTPEAVGAVLEALSRRRRRAQARALAAAERLAEPPQPGLFDLIPAQRTGT